eukprot:COSAG06_NODE_56587_length_284_cov_0.556757_1_plen_80_part_10
MLPLGLEPYATHIGGGGGQQQQQQAGGGKGGGIVWGSFVQLEAENKEEAAERQLPAVVTASTAKTLTVWRMPEPAAAAAA